METKDLYEGSLCETGKERRRERERGVGFFIYTDFYFQRAERRVNKGNLEK